MSRRDVGFLLVAGNLAAGVAATFTALAETGAWRLTFAAVAVGCFAAATLGVWANR